MKAVVLAGGSGKRVFPLAVNKPKPMFKILEKPLMQRVLESLRGGGIREIVAVIGHNAEQISDYFGNGSKFGVKIEYAYQDKALGMAHALQCAESRLNGKFAVFNADDIFDASLVKQLVQKSKKAEAVLAAQQVEETWKYGIIALDGDSVTKIVEKPAAGEEPSNNAVVGAYALTEGIFDYCRKRPVGDAQFEEALQAMIDDGRRVKAVGYKGFFGSYKYPWDLFRLNEHFLDEQALGPGLVRDERHADHFFRDFAGVFRRLRELHPAAFAASAGEHLGLQHPRTLSRLLDRVRQFSGVLDHAAGRGNGDAVSAKNVLTFVFEEFHRGPLLGESSGWSNALILG
ncbi:hypothetical protein COY71_01400 [Candidatus Micrarchaeota archaeon CG_4_10_14_0_8_um_filter_60_7]|nr:MAG: hypothetical protein COY71_01400 [Candidatus Micrarchaeota archaeon CG_4_10_14_0_8_um_filter_60_7]